jgi:uncharacterized RDD family membrane protein YckC
MMQNLYVESTPLPPPVRRAPEPQVPELAHIGSRVVARVIDWSLVGCAVIPSAALMLALGGGRAMAGRPQIQALVLLPAFMLLFVLALYQWYSTATDGTTIGKRLMGIHIERDDGKAPGFVKGVVLRSWVFSAASAALSLTCVGSTILTLADLGFAFSDDRRKTLHDRLAGTRVMADD